MSVRSYSRRPARLALVLTLVGATALLAGCGDGAHLPAGSSGASMYGGTGGTGVGVLDSALGTDPGPTGAMGVTTSVDDPVLAGYDGVDNLDSLGSSDVFAQAKSEFDESAGMATTGLDDDSMLDDGYDNVGYGYGRGSGYGGYGNGNGWGSTLGTAGLLNSYGYGGSSGYGGYGNDLGAASLGGYGAGDMYGGSNGGFIEDPTLGDTTFDDLGGSIDDPSIGIGAADTSLDDGGFGGFDSGFSPVMDSGFDSSMDANPGIVDTGGFDTGFDPGMGGFDTGGFDPGVGAIDTGGFDTGGFDTGGFDAGVGGMDIGGMDAGIGF